ncbi:MAG: hypothetical protein AAGF77_05590 [Bacteroidota bacterium]
MTTNSFFKMWTLCLSLIFFVNCEKEEVMQEESLEAVESKSNPFFNPPDANNLTGLVAGNQRRTVKSKNGRYLLAIDHRGVLASYKINPDNMMWFSPPTNYIEKVWELGAKNIGSMSELHLTDSGVLELRNNGGSQIWKASTDGQSAKKAKFTNDGHLELLNGSNRVVWSTKTTLNYRNLGTFHLFGSRLAAAKAALGAFHNRAKQERINYGGAIYSFPKMNLYGFTVQRQSFFETEIKNQIPAGAEITAFWKTESADGQSWNRGSLNAAYGIMPTWLRPSMFPYIADSYRATSNTFFASYTSGSGFFISVEAANSNAMNEWKSNPEVAWGTFPNGNSGYGGFTQVKTADRFVNEALKEASKLFIDHEGQMAYLYMKVNGGKQLLSKARFLEVQDAIADAISGYKMFNLKRFQSLRTGGSAGLTGDLKLRVSPSGMIGTISVEVPSLGEQTFTSTSNASAKYAIFNYDLADPNSNLNSASAALYNEIALFSASSFPDDVAATEEAMTASLIARLSGGTPRTTGFTFHPLHKSMVGSNRYNPTFPKGGGWAGIAEAEAALKSQRDGQVRFLTNESAYTWKNSFDWSYEAPNWIDAPVDAAFDYSEGRVSLEQLRQAVFDERFNTPASW